MRTLALALAAAILATGAGVSVAADPRQVKVSLEFRQTGSREESDLGGRGSIVIHGSGRSRSSVGLDARSTTTRTRRSSGVFTIVQDGGSSSLAVATRLPYEEIRYFHDYATGAGYVSSGVVFEDVGTSLAVSASIVGDDRIRVRLTPRISFLSADGSGAIDFTEAATELVVRNGEPITIGGATSEAHELTRRILGLGSASDLSETSLVLTATLL